MEFKKPVGNEEGLLDMFTPEDPAVIRKKMFGYPAAFVNGRMFMGTYGGQLILKLESNDLEEFMKNFGASPFAPVAGRIMTGFVEVPEDLIDDEPTVREWVEKSLRYVESLPPKK